MILQNKILYQKKISQGKQRTKDLKLAVCVLARDCEQNITKNINKIIKLQKYFLDLQVYILENDSKDKTRTIIQKYVKKYNFIHLYSLNDYPKLNNKKIQDLLQNDNRSIKAIRMQRMALLRDLILEKAKSDATYNTHIYAQIDVDVSNFSTNGFLHSFATYDEWDCVFANGRWFALRFHALVYNTLFDSYALLPYYYHQAEKIKMNSEVTLQQTYAPLTKYMYLYPVQCAFGGIGIYKANVIKNINYYDSCKKDKFNYCEHISFCKQLKNNKLYINPAMVVHYNHPLSPLKIAIRIGKIVYQSKIVSVICKILHYILYPVIKIYFREDKK